MKERPKKKSWKTTSSIIGTMFGVVALYGVALYRVVGILETVLRITDPNMNN